MSINLSKGERISLSKEAPGMKKAVAGLGWDVNVSDTGSDFDLDVSVFMLGANEKIPQEKYFVFYNNLKSPDDSVESMGDSRTGKGEGDDEAVHVDLLKVDSTIEQIVFVVTIYEADKRRQNFGQVRNSYIRISDEETQQEIAKYELEEDFSRETAIEFGKFYRKDEEWKFHAVGEGFNTGLQSFVEKYT